MPLDLSVVSFAAQNLANIEDNLIFYGNEFLGVEGILNAKGTQKLKLSDWGAGENPYKDIVKAINMITEKGIVGKITLCLSRGLYFDLQRIQQGTGMTEAQRISSMIGNLFNVSVIKDKKARRKSRRRGKKHQRQNKKSDSPQNIDRFCQPNAVERNKMRKNRRQSEKQSQQQNRCGNQRQNQQASDFLGKNIAERG